MLLVVNLFRSDKLIKDGDVSWCGCVSLVRLETLERFQTRCFESREYIQQQSLERENEI